MSVSTLLTKMVKFCIIFKRGVIIPPTRFIYVMFLSTVDDDDELLISALRDAETLHLPDDSDQVLIEAAPLNAGCPCTVFFFLTLD